MEHVFLKVGDSELPALLIRESNPRLVLCQDRVVAVNPNNTIDPEYATVDLLALFPSRVKV